MVRHREVIDSLEERFKDSFNIVIESGNRLPLDTGAFYNPDLVFRSKKNNKIRAIIEVEGGARKHMVGGVITADYYVMKEGIKKPLFCVLALTERHRKAYLRRRKLLRYYAKRFKNIIVGNREDVIGELEKMRA